jgi:putative transposase
MTVRIVGGISTGGFSEALAALLARDVPDQSANTISRVKVDRLDGCERWPKRDLSARCYVNFWTDGVYFAPRIDEDRQRMLVIIGARKWGNEDVNGQIDGFRESTQSRRELLVDAKHQRLGFAPKLAIVEGVHGFWAALREVHGMA